MPDGPEVRAAVRAAADAAVGLLRSLDGTAALTAGGVWTVRETAVHLIASARLYTSLLTGAPSPLQDRSHNDPFNAGAFLALSEDRPVVLADLLAAAVDRFEAVAASVDPAAVRPWHRGLAFPSAVHLAIVVNELLMHGTDIAKAAACQWGGDEGAAAVAWQALAPWQTPMRFLPEAAEDLRLSFSITAPPSPPLTFRIADGAVTPGDPVLGVECRIEGPPMPLLRWYYHRDPWPEAGLQASGPRADVAPRLADLLRRI